MATLARRILTVLACLIGLMWTCQFLFTREHSGRAAGPTPDANLRPTRPVTVRDVLEANIPNPTRSKVSFPEFSYRQAFPEARDQPEIVIARFDEAPMLKDLSSMPPEWRGNYPPRLPPVEERLPRNPAVVVGPDSPGRYGGVWRRVGGDVWEFTRKLCYESFMRYDPSGRLSPCLAYKWEANSDNRVYTLYLRKGHKWSDGQPFAADDEHAADSARARELAELAERLFEPSGTQHARR